jgi:hypothetical protein
VRNVLPYSHHSAFRPFAGAACAVFAALLLPAAGFANSPDPLTDAPEIRPVSRSTQQSSRAFLAEMRSAFAQASAESLPQQFAAAIELRRELTPEIAAEAVRAIGNAGGSNDPARCASVEQIVSAAMNAHRSAAMAITRKTVAAAPSYRDCIVSAATAGAPESRMAFLRAARQGELMHAVLARIAERGGEGAGTLNPANVAGNGEGGNVRSPEQPPNNNPPNNPPNSNNPPNNPPNHPPNVPRPRGNRGPHHPSSNAP